MQELIFDTHAHYDDDAFDEDRDELLNSLKEQGVGKVINVGASITSTKRTIELMNKYSFVYGILGVHPSDTAELTEADMDWLKEQFQNPKAVAVGEIGLDYYWDEPTRRSVRIRAIPRPGCTIRAAIGITTNTGRIWIWSPVPMCRCRCPGAILPSR